MFFGAWEWASPWKYWWDLRYPKKDKKRKPTDNRILQGDKQTQGWLYKVQWKHLPIAGDLFFNIKKRAEGGACLES